MLRKTDLYPGEAIAGEVIFPAEGDANMIEVTITQVATRTLSTIGSEGIPLIPTGICKNRGFSHVKPRMTQIKGREIYCFNTEWSPIWISPEAFVASAWLPTVDRLSVQPVSRALL